jgi:hypothetical protein
MTQVMAFVILGIILLFDVVVVVFGLFWSKIRKKLGDNPKLAWVFIETKKGFDIERGKWLKGTNKEESVYEYKWYGKKEEIRCGPGYPWKYVNFGRLIVAAPGELIAKECLQLEVLNATPEPQFSPASLSRQTLGYLMNEGIDTLKAKSGIAMRTVLLVIGIAVIAAVGVWYFTSHNKAATGTTQSTTTTTTTPAGGVHLTPLPTSGGK